MSRYVLIDILPDNNNSYVSPVELSTNATYNSEAETEYNTYKTGKSTSSSLRPFKYRTSVSESSPLK